MFIDGGGGDGDDGFNDSKLAIFKKYCQSSFSISGVDDQFSVIASFSTDAI